VGLSYTRMAKLNGHPEHHDQHFMTEKEIVTLFEKKNRTLLTQEKKGIAAWIDEPKGAHEFTYRHHDMIPPGNSYYCDTIVDKWFEWFLRTPASVNPFTNPRDSYQDIELSAHKNVFLFNSKNTRVYFTTVSPFQTPDLKTIIMTERLPLLVPVYNMLASSQFHPSLETDAELTELITTDLAGVRGEKVEAKFDGTPFHGCCVIRKKSLTVTNVPKDNVMGIPEERLKDQPSSAVQICHGGFWLLIKEEKFTPGDHLLYFKAESKNYEIEAKILISVLS